MNAPERPPRPPDPIGRIKLQLWTCGFLFFSSFYRTLQESLDGNTGWVVFYLVSAAFFAAGLVKAIRDKRQYDKSDWISGS